MKNNQFLLALLIAQTISVLSYTLFAVQTDGLDLFSVFIHNLLSLNWNGQFNLDFSCYLTLSGLWVMWRNKFTVGSIGTGLLAMVLGIVFFAPYVLYLLISEKGDLTKVLIGNRL